MALMGKKEWRLIMNLVIAFQMITTCFYLNVLVFIFSEHCYKPYQLGTVSGFLGQAGRFWPSFAQLTRGFFQESFKVQNYFKSNTLFTPAKHVQFNCVKLNEHQKKRTEQLNFLNGTLKYWVTNLYFHCVEFEVDKHWLEQLIIHSKEGLTLETSA